jgi:hypothetical protein
MKPQVYEYMPLETLVANFCSAIGLEGKVRKTGILNRVTLTHASVVSHSLSLDIYFMDGKLHQTFIYASVEDLNDARHIPAMINAAQRIIARHEYHERMKADNA